MGMEKVETHRAPAAIGPYSQAIKAGGFVFVSGQIPLTPEGVLVEGGVEDQARQALQNLKAVLEAAGSGLDRVVQVTAYLTDIAAFQAFNRVYAEFFTEPYPARAVVGVAELPKGAKVEVAAVALGGA